VSHCRVLYGAVQRLLAVLEAIFLWVGILAISCDFHM